MRVIKLLSNVATRSSRFGGGTCRRTIASVSRGTALARWNATSAEVKEKEKSVLGKGMDFASGIVSNLTQSTRTAMDVASTPADVKWDVCERMDFLVQYCVPSNWLMAEHVRENSVAIQAVPPQTGEGELKPSVHGISVNCFAYMKQVKEPNCGKLMHAFLRRFNASVNNSLEICAEAAVKTSTSSTVLRAPAELEERGDKEVSGDGSVCALLAQQLKCAVAEISFTPAPGQPLARGFCRAFYNSNKRFHYVVVVAVPADEYEVAQDLIIHALVAVVEGRVEAAAKRT